MYARKIAIHLNGIPRWIFLKRIAEAVDCVVTVVQRFVFIDLL